MGPASPGGPGNPGSPRSPYGPRGPGLPSGPGGPGGPSFGVTNPSPLSVIPPAFGPGPFSPPPRTYRGKIKNLFQIILTNLSLMSMRRFFKFLSSSLKDFILRILLV